MAKRIRVAFIQYTTPAAYPPVMNAASILADKGAEVSLWGCGAYGAADKLQVVLRPGVTQRLMKYAAPGWRQKIHYVVFLLLCVFRTLWWRPKFVYVSDLRAYPIGLLISYIPRVSVIAHEHDTPPEDGGRSVRLFQWVRRRLFRRAKATVVPQEQRARLVAASTPVSRIEVVWNCPRIAEIVPLEAKDADRQIVLWYHGSVVPSQFPEAAIRSIALMPDNVSLRFAGYATIGQPRYIDELLELANELGIANRVTYVGTKPTREDLFLEASRCDIGLSLFARNFREAMVGASNKPFDYLACGLAVLTNDTEEWRAFYAECPCVRSCDPDSAEAIALKVSEFVANPAEFQVDRRLGQAMMQCNWNYENQFSPVANLILS